MPLEGLEFRADPWIFWFAYRDAVRQEPAGSDTIAILVEAAGEWPPEVDFQPIYGKSYPQRRVRTGRVRPDFATLQAVRRQVKRLKIARPVLPQLGDARAALGAASEIGPRPAGVDGSGVVIGFVDNGCAFAHRNFALPAREGMAQRSRVTRLWDQSRRDSRWSPPMGFDYGRTLPPSPSPDTHRGPTGRPGWKHSTPMPERGRPTSPDTGGFAWPVAPNRTPGKR